MRLTCEQLESRDVPSGGTLADILDGYLPGYDPVPGADPSKVKVAAAKLGTGPTDPVYDVFFASGPGQGPRIVVRDTQTGVTLADRVAFGDEDKQPFRDGIESVAVIGTDAFASPGVGGGPVIYKISLVTFESSVFPVRSYPFDWRGGLNVSHAETDATPGVEDLPGGDELLVLPAGDGGGPVLLVLDPATGEDHRPPILFAPIDQRGVYRFAPAGVQVQVSPGVYGCLIQLGDDPATTRRVGFDGVVYPDPTLAEEFAAAL